MNLHQCLKKSFFPNKKSTGYDNLFKVIDFSPHVPKLHIIEIMTQVSRFLLTLRLLPDRNLYKDYC